MSPEIIKNSSYFGDRTDCWSLGILLYTILCGKFPFKGSFNKDYYLYFIGISDRDLFLKIKKGKY